MARPIDKAEFQKETDKRVAVLRLMPEGSLVCPACLSIFEPGAPGERLCWCDYESDWRERE